MQFATLLENATKFVDSTVTVRAGTAAPVVRKFPELVADVRRLADALTDVGVKPGHCVGLHASGSYAFIVWDLALVSIAAVPHVFPEDWSEADIEKTVSTYRLAFSMSHLHGTLPLAAGDDLTARTRLSADTAPADEPDLLTRVYSSGTTGKLKGLIITRSGAEDVSTQFIDSFEVNSEDRYLFFLPLSHFQQRLSIYTCLAAGASMMLTPYTHVFHDVGSFGPTFMIAPPVFYEVALATFFPRGSEGRPPVTPFGGRLRFLITGMAPIRRNVLDAYRSYGLPLMEAYGITEVGLIAWNTPRDNQPGTVGRPLRNHLIRFSEDDEILVQALHPLSKGYFEADAEDSARTFLADGAIATGDIGEFNGTHLVLRGRKKDVIVTSEGLKFHPAAIEERVLACDLVRQAVVITDLHNNDIVAVLSVDDPADSTTIAAVNKVIDGVNRNSPSSARIARTVMTQARFSVENGMLTRNLKPNRRVISQHFSTR